MNNVTFFHAKNISIESIGSLLAAMRHSFDEKEGMKCLSIRREVCVWDYGGRCSIIARKLKKRNPDDCARRKVNQR
jgi:hypothetical protein